MGDDPAAPGGPTSGGDGHGNGAAAPGPLRFDPLDDRLWGPGELRALCAHQLDAPLAADLGSPAGAEVTALSAAADPTAIRTFRDLLGHPNPPPRLLELAGEFAAAVLRRRHAALPTEIARALHLGCAAAALLRHGRLPPGMDEHVLHDGLSWLRSQDWPDPLLHSLAAELLSRPGTPPDADAATRLPQIDGYEVLARLGEGGMGSVWRAVQLSTRREVALKLLGTLGSDKARRRFEREVELTSRLEHPHIARVYDSGTCRGQCYYAMQLVPGEHLDRYVTRHKPERREVLRLMRDVCQAVEYAHARGIVHRDLKPSNVLVDGDGQVHVMDFGLARAIDLGLPTPAGPEFGPTVTAAGQFVGSLPWASPEQVEGLLSKVDARSDVYSLGVMLYWVLTGSFPYPVTGTVPEVMRHVLTTPPIPPSRVTVGTPARPRRFGRLSQPRPDTALDAVVLKALAKAPADRYASAGELAADLSDHLLGRPTRAAGPRPRRWGRMPVLAMFVIAAAFFGLGYRPATTWWSGVIRGAPRPDSATPASATRPIAVPLTDTPGVLDRTFGNGGTVTSPFPQGGRAYAVTTQHDGRILVAGSVGQGESRRLAVARFNPDGTPDSTFGTAGHVVWPSFGGPSVAHDIAVDYSGTPQTNPHYGKVVVAGYVDLPTPAFQRWPFILRFRADGTPDGGPGGFGTGDDGAPPGTALGDFGYNAPLQGLAIDNRGRVLVAGPLNSPRASELILARYRPDGSLDDDPATGFGTGRRGSVRTPFGGLPSEASSVLIQPDGKVVVVGHGTRGNDVDIVLARYTPDGELDVGPGGFGAEPGSGKTGKVRTHLRGEDYGFGAALQADGKILVAGASRAPGGVYEFTVVRYNADGTMDTSFNGTGRVHVPFGDTPSENFALVVTPDGKIVTGGILRPAPGGRQRLALARLNADGQLDASFGAGGRIIGSFGTSSWLWGLAVQPDGKVIAVGSTGGPGSPAAEQWLVARFNTGLSYGPGGGSPAVAVPDFPDPPILPADWWPADTPEEELIARFPFASVSHAVASQHDGKFVVAGLPLAGDRQSFTLARYHPDGKRDRTFGTAGRVVTDFGGDAHAHAVTIDYSGAPDTNPHYGKIVVVGCAQVGGTTRIALARYRPDGTLDAGPPHGFGGAGGDGTVTASPVPAASAHAYAVAVDGAGRVLVGGSIHDGKLAYFALARYRPDGSPDAGPGGFGDRRDGWAFTDFSGGFRARIQSILPQPDGKVVAIGFRVGDNRAFLARYRGDGTHDDGPTGFGNPEGAETKDGLVMLGGAYGHTGTVQPDGRVIVIGGYSRLRSDDRYEMGLTRFHPDGAPDVDFWDRVMGSYGRFRAPASGATGVAVRRDGTVVVAGIKDDPAGGYEFVLSRYGPDGTHQQDAVFGSGQLATPHALTDRIRRASTDTRGRFVSDCTWRAYPP